MCTESQATAEVTAETIVSTNEQAEKEHAKKSEDILNWLYTSQDLVMKGQEMIEGHIPNAEAILNCFRELEARIDYKICFYEKIVIPTLEEERKKRK